MGLPTSDSAIQGDGLPVSGALLQELQACIRGMKHPEIEDGHAAATWTPTGTAVFDDGTVSSGLIKMVDQNGMARLDLGYIPAGTRLTSVTWCWHTAGGGLGQVHLRLMKRQLSSSAAPTTVATATVNNTPAGADHASVQVYNVTFAAGFAYWLELDITAFADADVYVIGASVKRDRL